MNEKLLLDQVKKLCMATGQAIDLIAHECNVHQDYVTQLYMQSMELILKEMEKSK